MDIITKAIAEVQPGEDDGESPNGSFHVILSAETKDRDGDTLLRDEWEDLPAWLNFDADHEMSCAGTIGSGVPTIEDDGCLHVRGTYTSLEQGQKIRTLVNEGHIRHTSVAFMTTKTTKDGKTSTKRELLNGAFVAIPSNREAVVLSSKGLDVKAGARNNAADQKTIQAIHDAASDLGASCSMVDAENADDGEMDGANKAATLDIERLADAVAARLTKAAGDDDAGYQPQPYHQDPDETVQCPVCQKFDDTDARYCDQCGTKLVGRTDVKVGKSASGVERKDAGMSDGMGRCAELAKATDAAIDEAALLFSDPNVDVESLPAEVRQGIDLVSAAAESVDELLDVLGVDDPDDDDDDSDEDGDEVKSAKAVTDASWDGSASRYSIEQWRAACLIGPSETSENKGDYKLPVREPNGDVNSNAVHAAAAALAGGRGGVDAPADEKKAAAKKLVALYGQLKEDPPDSVLELAGESPKDSPKSADPATADVKSAAAVSADEDKFQIRARALLIQAQAQALL